MITEALVRLLVSLFNGLVQPLPPYTLDTAGVQSQSVQAGALASALNGYAPIAQLGAALVLLLALKLALLLWQGVVFIYHQFWGSS